MLESDRKPFWALVGDVYAFYRVDCTPFALGIWWDAMRPYDLTAVSRALSAHAMNPDAGQFLPKPADVVRMLQGGTLDQAMQAWTKVEQGVARIGPYRDVVFDDALIHAVIVDMGLTWQSIGEKREGEWPALAKEFAARYRGYAMRRERPSYPPVLIGIAGAVNRKAGADVEPPVLLGDPERARAVMAGGSDVPRLTLTPVRVALAELVA